MNIVISKMKALPEKLLGFLQTLAALMKSTRKEKGCLSHNVFQDIENDNSINVVLISESMVRLAMGSTLRLMPL